MPFTSSSNLPSDLRRILPQHAQEIFVAAFNSAYDQYDEKSERREGQSREETAHAIAWSAVKKKYTKNEATGRWKAREN